MLEGGASGCPINNLIPEWNDLIFRGLWKEALERMTGVYPAGLPLPEDAAAEALPEIEQRLAAEQQQQGQSLAASAIAPPAQPPGGVQVPVEGFA